MFPNSGIKNILYTTEAGPGQAGTVLTVEFVLDGQPVIALNGGPLFTFSEAISLVIGCKDQAEVDYYWDKLTADGGEESMCGWLKDKYGLSWQVDAGRHGGTLRRSRPAEGRARDARR